MLDSSPVKVFCTTREAAARLGVSLRTIQLWSEKGLLRAWKTEGGHRRISTESVEGLLYRPAQRTTPVGAPAFHVLVAETDQGRCRYYREQMGRWPWPCSVSFADNVHTMMLRLGNLKPELLVARQDLVDTTALAAILSEPSLAGLRIVLVANGIDAQSDLSRFPQEVIVLPNPLPFERLQAIAGEALDRKPRTSGRG